MGPACQFWVKEKEKGKGGVYGLKEVGPARRPNISAWLSLVRSSVTWAGLRERLAGRLGCAARLTGLVEDGGPSSSSSFSFPPPPFFSPSLADRTGPWVGGCSSLCRLGPAMARPPGGDGGGVFGRRRRGEAGQARARVDAAAGVCVRVRAAATATATAERVQGRAEMRYGGCSTATSGGKVRRVQDRVKAAAQG